MRVLKNKGLILFFVGAIGYMAIELLWRGRTHWSMSLAGGLSFMGMGEISRRFKKRCLFTKALISAALITFIELIFGILFNILLKKNVWDYSNMPLNFKGQICLVYSIFWIFLSLLFIPIAGKICNKQSKK